jgi:hypothetical protein
MVAGSTTERIRCPESGYRAYLLRCWQEEGAGPDGEPAWRFTLGQPGDEGRRRGFASLEALVVFLQEELDLAASGLQGLERAEARWEG